MAAVDSIYRYPVKGLNAERLTHVNVAPGETLPDDRLYAIENGPSGFDPAKPYLPKQRFLMLMKNERLAALRATFDHDSHVLTIVPGTGGKAPTGAAAAAAAACTQPSDPRSNCKIHGDLRTAEGRAAIEDYFAAYCADALRGPPKILSAPGHSFSDVALKVVSIINLASVAALAETLRVRVHPLRFRANVYVSGWPAWSELDLVGRTLVIGRNPVGNTDGGTSTGDAVRLKVVKRIVRCAATNVDPDTAARDLNVPQTLMQTYGHADCGVYAEVMAGGEIAQDAEVLIA